MRYNTVRPQSQTQQEQASAPFDLRCLFGIGIGPDTSNAFGLTLSGIAVRRNDLRYVSVDTQSRRVYDVTPLIIGGANNLIFRLPATTINPGDLIITSDYPVSSLFVLEVRDQAPGSGYVIGIDPNSSEIVQYVPPANLFFPFYVRVVSVLELLGSLGDQPELGDSGGDQPGGGLSDLLPLLLLCTQTPQSSTSALFTTIFLFFAMQGGLE